MLVEKDAVTMLLDRFNCTLMMVGVCEIFHQLGNKANTSNLYNMHHVLAASTKLSQTDSAEIADMDSIER